MPTQLAFTSRSDRPPLTVCTRHVERSGAELDRIASTSNYGRRVLRRWHTGQIGDSGAPMPGDRLNDYRVAVPGTLG
jgi:hypothetical protein